MWVMVGRNLRAGGFARRRARFEYTRNLYTGGVGILLACGYEAHEARAGVLRREDTLTTLTCTLIVCSNTIARWSTSKRCALWLENPRLFWDLCRV